MLCASWLVAAALLCFHSPPVEGRCSDLIGCLSLESNEQKLKCINQCRSERESSRDSPSQLQRSEEEQLEEESLSLLLSALSPLSTELQTPVEYAPAHNDQRRSYAMEHFRWGKPMGRKRRPIKVFSEEPLDEEHENEEPEEEEEDGLHVERRQSTNVQIQQRNNPKTNGRYRMTHFRWSSPPEKRYGGVARPYSQQSQRPFFTLLQNVITNGQEV